MLGLPLAFAAPALLAALVALPAIWWLLRVTPPRPREIPFPPLKLILDLKPKEEQPAKTPLWLLILRLATAAAIILAMAGPIWNPPPASRAGAGPLLVIVDDGWPAAPTWEQRLRLAAERVAAAGRAGRASALAPVSAGEREILLAEPARTLERLRALKPAPHTPDRDSALGAVAALLAKQPRAQILWIADGLETGGARAFAERLAALAPGRVDIVTSATKARALAGPDNSSGALTLRVLRAEAAGPAVGKLRALDLRGLPIGDADFAFADGLETQARFDLPVELRNEIARVEIVGEPSAGAVSLLDERWRRRRVAVISGATIDTAQPLLAPTYYLGRALAPFADVREMRGEPGQAIATAIDEGASALILADVGVVAGPSREKLARFIDEGGLLLRFAGTRLAASSDDLTPVKLRRGGRVLGGSLSWEAPRKLAPFERESPFFGLATPEEVTVTRQVLAEPEPGLAARTWAALADGTPLVTARKRDKGLIVLFHVTADTTWSNLPLSGLFVDMLRRVVAMSARRGGDGAPGPTAEAPQTVAPLRTLDGFGAFGAPPVTAKAIPVSFDGIAGPDHPPGFYGPVDSLVAVNAMGARDQLRAADFSGLAVETHSLRAADPVDLRGPALALAILGLIADAIASLWLGGGQVGLFSRRRAGAAAAALLACLAFPAAPPPASAQQAGAPQRAFEAALTTRLAYALTGDRQADEASRAGLAALSRVLRQRTSLAPGEPVGVDPARDELTFYPLIYWPVTPGQPQPPPAAVTKIAAFMKQGGTIVFDTRDALTSRPGGPPTPEARWLQQLLAGVDVPELEPIPKDHVVTKTFYLLDGFVGRTTVGETWIEALPRETSDPANRPARAGDSVSPIIITSNDLAAAWALDNSNEPMFPLIPGGARQRELALRGGVNLVMYTLTGNYKADQVHVKDLLERLGL